MIETKIQWTDSTFNPWWGCVEVSDGCANCYARTFDKRVGGAHWGKLSERRFFGDKHWAEPLKWEKKAAASGKPWRVFCASMADVFEDRPELSAPRARLHALVRDTPHLTWLLLTKRPEHAARLWGQAHYDAFNGADSLGLTWAPNVWLGTTAENQQNADERIPHLMMNNTSVRFVSAEPLLGPLDLSRWLKIDDNGYTADGYQRRVDWVIIGGESGARSRPFNMAWARSLLTQCHQAEAAAFFKQAGARPYHCIGHDCPAACNCGTNHDCGGSNELDRIKLRDAKGGDIEEMPAFYRVREWPAELSTP